MELGQDGGGGRAEGGSRRETGEETGEESVEEEEKGQDFWQWGNDDDDTIKMTVMMKMTMAIRMNGTSNDIMVVVLKKELDE